MREFYSRGGEFAPEPESILNPSPVEPLVAIPMEELETSVPARFAKIVRQYPDRLALKKGARALTYEQLDRAASRIAQAIPAKSCEAGQVIAVLFEPGIDAISAILSVLKSGCAYVALDPSFPKERLKDILRDSRACLVVTDGRNEETARELAGVGCAFVNVDAIGECADASLYPAVSPNDLAAITYTSGSTGVPKGVAHTHRNLMSKCFAYSQHKRITPDDRLSLLHSLGFAASHGNLLISLLNGAALYPFDIKSAGVLQFAEWLKDERISISHMPVMVFRELAEGLRNDNGLASLRIIYLSGAPITKQDFDLYKGLFSARTQLEIGMGSTETGHICLAMLDKSFSFPEEGTPLGYPLPGKRVFLIDEYGKEVGSNEIGEIAVRSADLSAGYWRQPELTKQKFLPVPGNPNEYVYKTGDLGRMLPDGFLIHLGRKDFMVKIRGYRVDVGEIERRLREHPKIAGAAVAYWDRVDGEKSLAGHVVLRPGEIIDVSELKIFLGKKLPDYMIPYSFRFLPRLPLTNGKLDRSALVNPGNHRPPLAVPYQAPGNELETKLAQIWAEVLVIEPVGVRDNFFDLGGHSLAASQIVSRIIQSFQFTVPMKLLFEAPTVADMAKTLFRHQAAKSGGAALAKILQQVEAVSEDEARRVLAKKGIDAGS